MYTHINQAFALVADRTRSELSTLRRQAEERGPRSTKSLQYTCVYTSLQEQQTRL